VRDLGYEEGPVQGWVSAMMLRLQAEVKEQESAKQRPTQTLHEELVLAESDLDDNVVEIGETGER
jgi:phosphatidate phosphatase APP1